jgi:hypothetical protein
MLVKGLYLRATLRKAQQNPSHISRLADRQAGFTSIYPVQLRCQVELRITSHNLPFRTKNISAVQHMFSSLTAGFAPRIHGCLVYSLHMHLLG